MLIAFIFSISQRVRIGLSLIYLGIIIVLSLMPSKDVPDISPFDGFDKVVHLSLYTGLAWLLSWALHAENKYSRYFMILGMAFLWGLIMEIFQYNMHLGRSFEWFDVLSNTSGALIGITVYHLMTRRRNTLIRRKNS